MAADLVHRHRIFVQLHANGSATAAFVDQLMSRWRGGELRFSAKCGNAASLSGRNSIHRGLKNQLWGGPLRRDAHLESFRLKNRRRSIRALLDQ